MKKIPLDKFFDESFIDDAINAVTYELDKKVLNIETTGADFECGTILVKASIEISNWSSLVVREVRGDDDSDTKQLVNDLSIKPDKILFFYYNTENLILRDVGDHCWVDWIFEKPEVTIYGEYKEEPNQEKE